MYSLNRKDKADIRVWGLFARRDVSSYVQESEE